MTVSAACFMRLTPTSVDPVKEILRAMPDSIQGVTTRRAEDEVTTLRTPSGSPASLSASTSMNDVSGVSCAGLSTIVQPAAIAGPILRVPIASGKFHGVMRMHGPTGSREIMRRFFPSVDWVKSPLMRTASSENQRKNSAP